MEQWWRGRERLVGGLVVFIGLYACIDMYKYLCEEEEEKQGGHF